MDKDKNPQKMRRMKKAIEDYLVKEKISQRELSRRCGFDPTNIWKYYRGMYAPSLTTLCRLAEVMDVPISDLIDKDEGGQDGEA